jgi:hypothetical protein
MPFFFGICIVGTDRVHMDGKKTTIIQTINFFFLFAGHPMGVCIEG